MYLRYFVLFVLLVLAIGGGFFQYSKIKQHDSPFAPDPSSALGKELPLITTNVLSKTDHNPESNARMNVPHVSILSNKGASEDINNYIGRISDDIISRFFESRKKYISLSTTTDGVLNTLSMDYKTELLTPQILSFRLTITKSIAEDPLPVVQTILLAFDCATGRTLEKDSLFGTISNEELASLFLTYYEGATSSKPQTEAVLAAIKSPHNIGLSPERILLVVHDPKPPQTLSVPLFYVMRYFKSHIKDALTSQTEMIRMSTPE